MLRFVPGQQQVEDYIAFLYLISETGWEKMLSVKEKLRFYEPQEINKIIRLLTIKSTFLKKANINK